MAKGRFCAAAGALLSLGCADLGDLEAGVCGNGIVDPAEDCDTSGGGCGLPESASECRFTCETNADCPTAHICGIDQVCRKHAGAFEQGASIEALQLTEVRMGDVDADALSDLVSLDANGQLVVSYMGGDGVSGTSQFQTTGLPFAVGQLTDGDSRADIAHLPGGQIGVLRSLAGRTLEPTAYSPFPVPEADARFFVLQGREPIPGIEGDNAYGGHEILMLTGSTVRSALGEALLFQVAYDASEVVPLYRETPTGNIDSRPQSPCDEFVMTKPGHDRVSVYTPCKAFGLGWNNNPQVLPPVMMPAGKKTGNGLMVVDANGDGNLDLLVMGEEYADGGDNGVLKSDVYVAFGAGDGTFSDGNGGIGVARLMFAGLTELPLDAGDLNLDGIVDFVFSQALVLSHTCPTLTDCWTLHPVQQAFWARAVIADFNANGLMDIAAVPYYGTYVDFLNGTGTGVFNTTQIPTQQPPNQIAVGDFDGDLVLDLAISEIDSSSKTVNAEGSTEPVITAPHDSLSILFGKLQGAPEAPVSMGRLDSIEAIAAGHFWFQGGSDFASDLGVLSRDMVDNSRSVALFTGTTNRQLQSPFFLAGASAEADVAFDSAIGKFSGAEHADLAALAVRVDAGPSGQRDVWLWLMESQGEAELPDSNAKPSNETLDQKDVDPCSLSLLQVDLDDTGSDVLLLFGRPKAKDTPGGRILAARPNGGIWELGNVVNTEQTFRNALTQRFFCKALRSGEKNPSLDPNDIENRSLFQVANLDGDATRELIVLTQNEDTSHRLSVFPLGPDVGTTFSDLTVPEGIDILGFHALQADGDPELELVIATSSAVYLAQVDGVGHALSNLDLLAGYEGDVPIPVSGRKDGPNGGPGFIGFFYYSLGIFGGDFNGDRLTDFAIARDTSIDLFFAQAVRP